MVEIFTNSILKISVYSLWKGNYVNFRNSQRKCSKISALASCGYLGKLINCEYKKYKRK